MKQVTLVGPLKSYTGKFKFVLGTSTASRPLSDEDAASFKRNKNFLVTNMIDPVIIVKDNDQEEDEDNDTNTNEITNETPENTLEETEEIIEETKDDVKLETKTVKKKAKK